MVLFVLAVVATGWAQSAVRSAPANEWGEPWLLEDSAPPLPSKPEVGTTSTRRTVAPPLTGGNDWHRFGSGLEDDAPLLAPNVFHQSGLEGLTSAQSTPPSASDIRFGSGLEDDAPARSPSIFHQSGLEGLIPIRAAHPNAAGLRFGSGLEDDAPLRSPSIFHQSGL